MTTDSFIVTAKQMALDAKLIPFDLWATKAHVLMLYKCKIISPETADSLISALVKLEAEYKDGSFHIKPKLGLHLTIEEKVKEICGEDSLYMHTARSRNDQVLSAELLYLRERLLEFMLNLNLLAGIFTGKANDHLLTVMPGYTHMQPAKPTTLAVWLASYSDMLQMNLDSLFFVYQKYNLSPLGAVESYGTSFPIDREYTSKLLGFDKVWDPTLAAISSRGFVQKEILSHLSQTAIVLSKAAADLLLFTTFEYNYAELSAENAQQMGKVTGSSVMPQKKNPDVLELVRALPYQISGFEGICSNLLAALPMGYNRDTREVKEYIEAGFDKTEEAVKTMASVLTHLKINKERMYEAVIKNYSMATDLADYLSQTYNLPYRAVYQLVGGLVAEAKAAGKSLSELHVSEVVQAAEKSGWTIKLTQTGLDEALDPSKALMKRKHQGGSSLKVMQTLLQKQKDIIEENKNKFKAALNKIKTASALTEKEVKKLKELI